MTHRHDAGSEGWLILQALAEIPRGRLIEVLGKQPESLYPAADPGKPVRLAFKDAIALDKLWKELYGKTPFFNLFTQELDSINSQSVPWGREEAGLILGGRTGDYQKLIIENNKDGVLDPAEREKEIERLGEIISTAQAILNSLIAGRPNPKAANDTNPQNRR